MTAFDKKQLTLTTNLSVSGVEKSVSNISGVAGFSKYFCAPGRVEQLKIALRLFIFALSSEQSIQSPVCNGNQGVKSSLGF